MSRRRPTRWCGSESWDTREFAKQEGGQARDISNTRREEGKTGTLEKVAVHKNQSKGRSGNGKWKKMKRPTDIKPLLFTWFIIIIQSQMMVIQMFTP
jgi:hypothetical protein